MTNDDPSATAEPPEAGATKTVPIRWAAAAALLTALAVAIVVGTTMAGSADDAPDVAAGRRTDQAPSGGTTSKPAFDPAPRDVTDVTAEAAATPATTGTPSPAATTSGPPPTPAPTPMTWQQQVATHTDAPARLNPLASDWTVEQLVIGKDVAGKFLGRATIRYSGPGSATGTFEIILVKDGREITRLAGQTAGEVRAGVYPVILGTDASYIDGPWTSQFRVISTARGRT